VVASALCLTAATTSWADTGEIEIVVLKERGVGSSTLAQPYVDRFVALAATENGWSAARGQYLGTRSAAESFIKAQSPHYGILSLAAFLALREPYHLDVIGRVASVLAGGEQYFIVSKTAKDLAGCKGESLASDHTADARFVERVVARGEFKLADFKIMQNQRPLQSIKQVLGGEATCALIDDAQLTELQHLPGGSDAQVVWKSKKLPPMAVVAFPNAPAAERKAFQEKLRGICDEDGQTTCAEVGIYALESAGAADYADAVSAYGH
jgi:hypothetical protein